LANVTVCAVAVGYLDANDFASRLDRAIERSGVAPKMIEVQPILHNNPISKDI
jgi:hypothetical protein